jgi:hypothetical protein
MTPIVPPLVVLALSSALVIQPAKDDPPRHVRTLTVSAAAAPTPALKYELLPRLRDRRPGNAAHEYRRAALLLPEWPRDPEAAKKQFDLTESWYQVTELDQLPVAEVRKYLAGHTAAFRALNEAARCSHCDWQLIGKLSAETLDGHLTEVQKYRELARVLELRIRADLAENKFDDAARHIATGLRLGKDVAEGATLIQLLVGLAITAVFQGELDRWIERPDAPNLYWALTTLPSPFIDARIALEGEAVFGSTTFPELKDLEKGPVSADAANRTLEDLMSSFGRMAGDGDPPGLESAIGKFGLLAYVALHHAEAKKQLIAMGRAAEEVEKMPAAQVVALRTILGYRALWDDQVKCFSLPCPKAAAELAKLREKSAKLRNSGDPLLAVFGMIVPATEKVYHSYARTDRRMAGLRAVEAIRLHAAANDGQLPRLLSDVTLVPVPDDPNTGKPFEYKVKGNTFTLNAPPPPGDPPHAANAFQYVVTVRK